MKASPGNYKSGSLFAALAFLLLFTASLCAQTLGRQDIADQRTAISSDTSLTEEARTDLLARLDAAQTQLEAAAQFITRTGNLKAVMDGAEGQARKFEQQLREAQAKQAQSSAAIEPDINAEQLEAQITLLLAERQAHTDRRKTLLQEIDAQPDRREQIKQRLIELQSQAAPPQTDMSESSPEQQVSRILALARQQSAAAEKESLETEVLSEPARSQVSAAERAWLGHALDTTEAKLGALDQALEQARSVATEEQLQTAADLQQQLQSQDPVLQQFAQTNRTLAEQLRQVASQTDTARREGLEIQALLEGIEQDSGLMHRRLNVAGRKEVLGRVMITRLDSLPDTGRIKREVSHQNELIASTSLAHIDIEEDFRAINERQEYLAALVPDLKNWSTDSRELVSSLVDQRARLLEDNLKSLGSLLRLLLDNNDKAGELIVATEEFHQFLLGNLLWIRNFSFIDVGTFTQQLAILFSPAQLGKVPEQLLSGYYRQSWSTLLLLACLLSLLLRWRLRPSYDHLVSRPILISGATLWHIVAGLFSSLLLVIPWPLLLYTTGYLMEAAEPNTAFSEAMGEAMMYTARLLYILLLTRLLASRQGVGRRFLKWDARMLDSLRYELNWAGPVVCLAFLINVFAFYLEVATSGGPLGALATTTIAASIITFSVRLLRQEIFADDALLRLGLRLSMFIGTSVIAMQLLGLLFAAEIYLLALGRSVIMLLLIKTIGDVFERWLLILRARLERKTREDQRELETDEESEEDVENLVDVMSLSEAHSKLLGLARLVACAVVMFVIWSPSLPALNLLDSIPLWHIADSADSGGPLRAITLFDLALSVIILIITGLVTKHLPSLSEVFMREWFNMSAGARYASSILMQYLVIAIGGSMFLATVGWEWGKVQWLVAAMGVGIGFGLQEIVANFISGIIILFERPVRVGDIISAGGAEGTVKKINPRATIIETFDRKEHLIPNKELITGQVINWTLSDGAVRIIIPVGIAYGSDVRKSLALLLEAASEVDKVLTEPEPRASFEDFGDNALLLWLRCYVSDDRVGTWTKLRTIINDKFNDAGIVISFPQRDIHLDTLEPLQIEIKDRGQFT